MSAVLSIKNLSVRRSEQFNLHIPSIKVGGGDILCVAGPNGGGKTTFIECVVGLLKPDAGRITILGQTVDNNLRATKANLGFVPDDEHWFVSELSAKEYFELLQHIYSQAGVSSNMKAKTEDLAQRLYFTAFDQQLGQLSHGNKKKVQLIAALMHEPKVIVLDELRNGLDPLVIMAAEEVVREAASAGACVVAATHDLWWAERIANNILLLVDGQPKLHQKTADIVKTQGSVEQLFMQVVGGRVPKHAV